MISRYPWLIVAAAALVVAGIAARIWGQEIREVETRALDALGIPVPVRVAGIAVLLGIYGYTLYARSKREAAKDGVPVLRRSVVLFALGSLGIVLALVLFAAVR